MILMVFEKVKAPNNKKDFMKWYEEQVKWEEEHSYESIKVASANLKNWFMEMIQIFPPMNGEFATDDLPDNDENLEKYIADYCIGKSVIYTSFAWSVAEEAYDTVLTLALKHNVGFFDVSGNEEIILSVNNKLE